MPRQVGYLTAVTIVPGKHRRMYRCYCACGKVKLIYQWKLRVRVNSCGCMQYARFAKNTALQDRAVALRKQGMSMPQIGKALGCSRQNVFVLLERARRRSGQPAVADVKDFRRAGRRRVALIAGRNLRQRRLARSLTQAELARAVGAKGRAGISQYETGDQGLLLVTCRRLCKALGCSLEDVLPTGNKPSLHYPPSGPTPAEVGGRLRLLRKERGLTYLDLWERSGLKHGAYKNAMSPRKRISLFSAWRIACALRVSLEDILPTRDQPGLSGSPQESTTATRKTSRKDVQPFCRRCVGFGRRAQGCLDCASLAARQA
jgi:transcriptional regulator with XRE-family HTH domain